MPIYIYECECGNHLEIIQAIGAVSPMCSKCGGGMVKMMTAPALVKMGGLTPSERKFNDGTASFTTGHTKPFQEGDPNEPVKEKQGRKWLAQGVLEGAHRDPEATYGRSRSDILRGNLPSRRAR